VAPVFLDTKAEFSIGALELTHSKASRRSA
jgi:hypothetical protein